MKQSFVVCFLIVLLFGVFWIFLTKACNWFIWLPWTPIAIHILIRPYPSPRDPTDEVTLSQWISEAHRRKQCPSNLVKFSWTAETFYGFFSHTGWLAEKSQTCWHGQITYTSAVEKTAIKKEGIEAPHTKCCSLLMLNSTNWSVWLKKTKTNQFTILSKFRLWWKKHFQMN